MVFEIVSVTLLQMLYLIRLVFLGLLILCSTEINAQNYIWSKSFGNQNDTHGTSITTDSYGNVYNVGYFDSTMDADPSQSIHLLNSNGQQDIYVTKFDKDGNFVWAHSFGGDRRDMPSTIRVDLNGDLVITGEFRRTVDFDPSTSSYTLTSGGPGAYSSDAFILKLDQHGNLIWAKQLTGSESSSSDELCIDKNNNIIITGTFTKTTDFDPGSGVHNIVSNNMAHDAFILKLGANGEFKWVVPYMNSDWNAGSAIGVDTDNNVIAAGKFFSTIDLDPNSNTYSVTSAGQSDIYFVKLDSNANLIWGKSFGGSGDEGALTLALDNSNNIYLGGYFTSVVDFNPDNSINLLKTSKGFSDIFLSKFDSSGDLLWNHTFGNLGSDLLYSMAIDNDNNLYATGQFNDSVDFNPSISIQNTHYANYFHELFILSLDSNGNFNWAEDIGDGLEAGLDLCIDDSRQIHITGYFSDSVDFDPKSNAQYFMTSHGMEDAFVLKLSPWPLSNSAISKVFPGPIVFPNPAKSFIVFEKRNLGTEGDLIIADVSGKVVHRVHISKDAPQYTLDTRNLKNGIYTYKFMLNSGVSYSGKFAIIR